MSEVVVQRRGLMAACLVLGAADLAFIDAVALPRVMGARSGGASSGASLDEGRPPPTPPALRAGGEPAIAVRAPSPKSDLLPRAAGEVGRGRPSPEEVAPSSLLPRGAGEAGRGSPSQEDVPRAPPRAPIITPTPTPTATLALTIHFDTGDAALDVRARAAVDAFAARAAGHPGWTFTVNGHADARGDSDFNARLSEQRAAGVVARLEAAGLSHVQAEAFGATRPLTTRDDPRSLRRNRRVEILIARGAP